jgi:hypothetical protein
MNASCIAQLDRTKADGATALPGPGAPLRSEPAGPRETAEHPLRGSQWLRGRGAWQRCRQHRVRAQTCIASTPRGDAGGIAARPPNCELNPPSHHGPFGHCPPPLSTFVPGVHRTHDKLRCRREIPLRADDTRYTAGCGPAFDNQFMFVPPHRALARRSRPISCWETAFRTPA